MLHAHWQQTIAASVRCICVLAVALILFVGSEQAAHATAPAGAPTAIQAGCSVELLFVGLEHADLRYDASNCAHPGETIHRVRIDYVSGSATGTAMPFTTAFSGDVTVGIPEALKGSPIFYTLVLELKPGDQVYPTGSGVTVPTDCIAGTLQHDETITPGGGTVVVCDGLNVPAAWKLTLQPATYAPPHFGDDTPIVVHGEFVAAAGVRLDVGLELHAAHTFSGLSGWRRVLFKPGSEGSEVSATNGMNRFYAMTGSDLPVKFFNFGIADDTQDELYIDNSAVEISGGNVVVIPSLTGGRPFVARNLKSVAIAMLEGQSYTGAMTIEQCEALEAGLVLGSGADVKLNAIKRTSDDAGGVTGRIEAGSEAKLLLTDSNSAYPGPLKLLLTGSPPGEATVHDNDLRYGVTLAGGAAQVYNNQFGGPLTLVGKQAANIYNNAFVSYLDFANVDPNESGVWPSWGTAGADPTISGNSFLGSVAVAAAFSLTRTMVIGANAYGDSAGPRIVDQVGVAQFDGLAAYEADAAGFLGPRGAKVQRGFFVSPPSSSGPSWTDSTVFPAIWIQGVRIGQNTFSGIGPAYLGKRTLIALDVAASQTIPNARVRADVDGVAYYAPPVTILRDLHVAGASAVAEGRTTANIIVPSPDETTYNPTKGMRVDVYLEIGNVPGSVGRPEGLTALHLVGMDFKFNAGALQRTYRVGIVPVSLFGMCWGNGDAGAVRTELEGRLVDQFRLLRPELQVQILPTLNHYCTLRAAVTNLALVPEAYGHLIASDRLGNLVGTFAGPNNVDHVVAAMPVASLPFGSDGLTLCSAPRYVMVDSGRPDAVIHELGHAMGQYCSQEQYKMFPTSGVALQGVTAFGPTGFLAQLGSNQLAHFPMPGDWWWRTPTWYDVMGASPSLNWPIPDTLGAFNAYFGSLRLSQAAGTALSAGANAGAGVGTVYLAGTLLADPARPGYTVLDPPTIRIMDVSERVVDESSAPYAGQPITWYTMEYFDAVGTNVSNNTYGVYAHWNDGQPVSSYYGWLPFYGERDKAVRLQLRRTDTNEIVYTRQRAASLATPILSPAAGATLTATMTIRWARGTQPLTRYVSFSSDNGATWRFGVWAEGDSLTLPTDFLPSSMSVILRSWTSDGFFNEEQRVVGLTVPNRSPTVHIVQPAAGAAAPEGTGWTLSAQATDVEDGRLLVGAWHSSRDGQLGEGPVLNQVILSAGDHTLTFTATDSQGAQASAAVQVRVGPVTEADLALPADALALWVEGRDPTAAQPQTVNAGITHTLSLKVAGAGVPLNVTVAVSMTPPGAQAQLLARATLPLAAFARDMLRTEFVPPTAGIYTFEGVVEAATLPDPVPSNNRRSWTYSDTPARARSLLYLPVARR